MKNILKKLTLLILSFSLLATTPAANISVSAADTETYPVDGSIFDDVAADSWYRTYVTFVLNKGLMVGVGNNLFSPDTNVTRAQFATIIYRMSGSPEVTYTKKFSDVPNNTYYSKAVTWASSENVGIILGYGNGKFAPDNSITREEMASLLYRYASYCGFIETEEDTEVEIPAEESEAGENDNENAAETINSDDVAPTSNDTDTTGSEPVSDDTDTSDSEPASDETDTTAFKPVSDDTDTTTSEPASDDADTTASEPTSDDSDTADSSDADNAVAAVAEVPKSSVLDPYADAKNISDFAKEPMQWVVENGIIVGESSTRLNPKGTATRAASAAVLQRIYTKYMNGQLPNIDLSASCSSITAAIVNENAGTFKITVSNPQAAQGIASIQAVVYSRADKSDKYTYTLTRQNNGSYQCNASTSNHHNNPGTYTVEVRVMLNTGIRIPVGTTTVKLINLWNMVLVNPWNYIPSGFSVELAQISSGQKVDKRIYSELNAMLKAMRAQGLSPVIVSSYRTQQKQETLFQNKVNYYLSQGYSYTAAVAAAGKWLAVPGTSEHQLGLALDIVDNSYWGLDSKQEKTAVQKWLMANSYKYGFILRYPSSKTSITGINYEPWHYRYVGKDVAKDIYQKGITFEEYLQTLK